MNRIVLVGSSNPIQKVLDNISTVPNIQMVALYTEVGQNSEIEARAQQLNIDVENMMVLKGSDGEASLRKYGPDWLISAHCEIIFPSSVLEVPKFGALNMHLGKLPEYAGMHAHQWAIRNGEKTFGSTLHWMAPKVDAGPIIYINKFPILPKDTGLSSFVKCLNAGTKLILKALIEIAQGRVLPEVQQDLSLRRLYTNKQAFKSKLSWELTAQQIIDFVRAADYWPFESPSYIPYCCMDNKQIILRKVQAIETIGKKIGQVLEINESGVVVTAGDGKCVLLTVVETENKVRLKNNHIAEQLGIKINNYFTNL